MQPISQGEDVDQMIISWLAKRIGHGKLIYATGSPEYSKKYYNKPRDYQPDYRAYLDGDRRHILGSYLSRPDGTTSVLAFDIDDPAQHAKHPRMLADLARAGAAPVYWQRQGERGHLELYFDRPVNPEQARAWCIRVCPLLQEVVECYPAADKRNQAIAWPLFQRKLDQVFPCTAIAIGANGERREGVSATDRKGLALLVTTALTSASLIETYQMPQIKNDMPPVMKPALQTAIGKQQTPGDLAKVVIAEFNAETTWEEVAALCGGFTRERKFKAVWRGERTPSVALDADEEYACDYGRTGTAFPKKLDKYEVWCLAQGGREFKRFDLAQRTAAYRERQKQQELQPSPPLSEPQQETRQETRPAQVPEEPSPDETGEEIVARLRGKRAVLTPLGRGRLWRIWPSEIGVVLDSDPGRVKFFRTLAEMRQVVGTDDDELLS